jgi:hypothetical protein
MNTPSATAFVSDRSGVNQDDTMKAPGSLWFSRSLFLLMAFAVLIRLFYWAYTGRTWDDALISVLHSENAARGLGLTHVNPGEPPLHGFTSPLSVLLPLVGDLVHVGYGLLFLKLLSAFAGAAAAWLGAQICLEIGLPPALALTAAAFLALDYHQILWGMAGMETQVVTLAYLYSIYCLQRGSQWQKGLSLGFAMLARPDAAIWVAFACAVELRRAWRSGSWRLLAPVFSGLALLYGPWLVFTFVYYGSPVPNTIVAKSMGYPSFGMQLHAKPALEKILVVGRRLFDVLGSLGPGYGGNGTGFAPSWDHRTIASLMFVLGILGAIVAFRKRHANALFVYAFVLFYTFYLTFVPNYIFGWYTAPVAAAAIIGSLYGFWQVLRSFTTEPSSERLAAYAGIAFIAAILSILPAAIRSDRYIQEYVDGGRKQLGLYLARVSLPADTVSAESLGYFGYYSQRTMYDYPGLCSPKVVRYLRDHPQGRSMISMMNALRPTYLVLRPNEYLGQDGQILFPWLKQDYHLVRKFEVPEEARRKILDSRLNNDFEFDVLRANKAEVTSTSGLSSVPQPDR